jgi:hypothetical protein
MWETYQILTQLVARLLEDHGDLLPSVSICKRHDGKGQLLYLEVRHDEIDMVYP